MDYMLTRWDGFTRFLGDGRLCLTNNAAERGLRGVALGRKAWLFCGSDRGGQRAAIPGTFCQEGRGNPLINIACAKAMTLQPTAEVADQTQRPPCC